MLQRYNQLVDIAGHDQPGTLRAVSSATPSPLSPPPQESQRLKPEGLPLGGKGGGGVCEHGVAEQRQVA